MSSPGPNGGPFEKFLRWLSPDRDEAARKHEEIRKKIVRYFVHKGCNDPHELFNKTIDRAVKIIDRGDDYSSPIALCYGVAKNVWRECDPPPDSLDGYDPPAPIPNLDHEKQLQCLDQCMEELPASDRDLINQYHAAQGRQKIENRKQLANEHGGNNSLRIKAFRIRARLRICITDCLKRAVN